MDNVPKINVGFGGRARYFGRYKILQEVMHDTFGELGVLIMNEPEEVKFYRLSPEWDKYERGEPNEIMTRISALEGEQLPAEIATKFYAEITPESIDFMANYHAPTPIAALKVVRNGESVLLLIGEENNSHYYEVISFDYKHDYKTKYKTWYNLESAVIDKMIPELIRQGSPASPSLAR